METGTKIVMVGRAMLSQSPWGKLNFGLGTSVPGFERSTKNGTANPPRDCEIKVASTFPQGLPAVARYTDNRPNDGYGLSQDYGPQGIQNIWTSACATCLVNCVLKDESLAIYLPEQTEP